MDEAVAQEHDDMPAGDIVAAHRSQPEFDFDDEDEEDNALTTAAPVPATTAVPTESARHEVPPAAIAVSETTTTQVPEPHAPELQAPEPREVAVRADTDGVEPASEETSSLEGMVDKTAGEAQPPFVLEPATMAAAETAAVGTPDAAPAESPVAPGLFDGVDASAPAPAEPAEAAALAVAERAEPEDRATGQA